MVRISKYKLKDDVLIKIYRLFFEIVSRSNSKDSFLEVIDDMFSPTEKIMLAKRLAIIYLLIKGIDQINIAKVLKVSTGTVAKFSVLFYRKDTKVVRVIKKMIKQEKILDFIDDMFTDLFIQPGIKMGHWRMYWENKKRKDIKEVTGL